MWNTIHLQLPERCGFRYGTTPAAEYRAATMEVFGMRVYGMRMSAWIIAAALLCGAGAGSAEVTVDEERLIGEWCLDYVEGGGEKDIENMNYEFLPGGKFRYQISEYSDKMADGTYEISGSELKLKPTLITLEVQTLNDREMTGKWFVMHHFSRGRCS